MRKPNLIIGKKHIILACLTLILGVAVYMNYAFASVEDDITAEKTMSGTFSDGSVEAANYGDAAFVSATGESDYFAQVRLARMTKKRAKPIGGTVTSRPPVFVSSHTRGAFSG